MKPRRWSQLCPLLAPGPWAANGTKKALPVVLIRMISYFYFQRYLIQFVYEIHGQFCAVTYAGLCMVLQNKLRQRDSFGMSALNFFCRFTQGGRGT